MGYFRSGSHELEAVRECPISSPLINRAIAAMWAAGENGLVPESLGEVQFFAFDKGGGCEDDPGESQLLLEIYVREGTDPVQFEPLSVALGEAIPELVGVAVFHGASIDLEAEKPGKRPVAAGAFGEASITYRTKAANFQVSAGSFFQTNRYLVDGMQELVIKGRKGASALDLYAGVGLFSVALAKKFDHVTAVEVSPYSFADLEHNAPANLTPLQKSTEDYLRQAKRSEFDFAVVDPPRAGLSAEIVRALARLEVPALTYVSCDPATLSRDLALLIKSGFRVERAHLIDLFPQTFHIESIFHLVR
jgi:23S rRNA (uracil1939-C5)-methyltransferase